jgi:serine/threonine protein kinase
MDIKTVIGRGGNGVVIRPPLSGKDDALVSKVLNDIDENEVAQLQLVGRLDRRGRYHVRAVEFRRAAVEDVVAVAGRAQMYLGLPLHAEIVMPYAGRQIDRADGAIFHALANVFAALRFLGRHGILHLDVKPANILYDGRRARLIDFGLAGTVAQCEQTLVPCAYQYWPATVGLLLPESQAGTAAYIAARSAAELRSVTGGHEFYEAAVTPCREFAWYSTPAAPLLAAIDTYSLGVTLLELMYRARIEETDPPLALRLRAVARKMIQPRHEDRVGIVAALEEYRRAVGF